MQEIVICLGSSCFARGNKKLVALLSAYLREHGHTYDIHFHGERCFGKCSAGPILRFDDQFLEKADEESLTRQLEEFLADTTH